MKNLWDRLFLEERPSIGLAFFRIFVALTAGFHVLPLFFRLDENYLHTAFKTLNYNFFTPEVITFVQRSPDWLVVVFAGLFCLSWFCFLVGFISQFSCIVMTVTCYYFYALNTFYIGTLSWDILLVTLFLMCLTPYHGDYFSIDCLRRGDVSAYRRQRPYFIQRLLQLQIGFAYFYTAIYLGIVFHVTLILTLDVSAIFFFLFPPQLLLFIDPRRVIGRVEQRRSYNQSAKRSRIVYDGNCGFCRHSLNHLKIMDLFDVFEPIDSHGFDDPARLHPQLTKKTVTSQLHLMEPDGKLHGGFEAFRRMCFSLPMCYPLIPLMYFPGMGILGPRIYQWVAQNRYLFHSDTSCRNNACFR